MDSAFELLRILWINAQLKAPASAWRTIIPRLHAAKEVGRLLAKPYLPVYELQGEGRGGPLTITFVGLRTAVPGLSDLFFAGKPVERNRGRVLWSQLGTFVRSLPTDLVVVAAAKVLIRKLPRQNAVVLPELLHHIVNVQGSWDDVVRRIHRSTRNNEFRRMRKYGYQYEVSHREEDFHEFYDQMYLPTMQSRHGEASGPVPRYEALQYFRHGWLFWITRDGVRVAGATFEPRHDTFNYRLFGIKDADAQLMREGAGAMIYYAALHWGNQQGYRAVNFLGTEAFMQAGLFQHKRRWGSTVSAPAYLHRQVWIKALRDTPAVCQFLKDTPCVTVDAQERLHGLVFVEEVEGVTEEMRAEWASQLMTPGLDSLEVRSVREFVRAPAGASSPGSVVQIAAQGG